MPSSSLSALPLPQLIPLLLRDPAPWRGISLCCFLPADARESPSLRDALIARNPDALVYLEESGEIIAFGVTDTQPLQGCEGRNCIYLEDITGSWPVASALLTLLTPSAAGRTKATMPATHSLMIVEDEPISSLIMEGFLKPHGMVISTSNAREAVANYMVHRPDWVFLDIHYANDTVDGFDVMQSLISADPDTRIVMVSADHSIATRIRAAACGAKGFITKPFEASDFGHYLGSAHAAG